MIKQETIITKEFSTNAINQANIDIDSLTAEQARFLIYCKYNPDECIEDGTRMVLTCDETNCVNPNHVVMIPPTIH